MTGPDDLRIGDTERNAAAEALGEHFALGRLSREEYDERSDQVWSARTRADLRPIFTDLPAPHGGRSEPPRQEQGHAPFGRRARWRGVPVLPILVLVVVLLVALPGPPWPLFILGWLWLAGMFRHGGFGHRGFHHGGRGHRHP